MSGEKIAIQAMLCYLWKKKKKKKKKSDARAAAKKFNDVEWMAQNLWYKTGSDISRKVTPASKTNQG